ncbi:MAG: hypothetical protein KJ697_01965 [Nanoarchaeota archaeon]|nr:hypothetical protein [Nanoarchaeota archaeon]MBU4124460.1 hypothetical protein [Nanoarchaeota archaeon]
MRKGISPLVATVLLIAITMAVAAVLANWVQTYTEEALPQSNCIGGQVGVISGEYPYYDDVNNKIVAVVEAKFVELSDFGFVILMWDDTVRTYDSSTVITLQPGTIGTITASTTGTSYPALVYGDVRNIQITTSCPDVKSGWYELQTP